MLSVIIDLLTVSTQAEHMTGLNNITPSLASLSMLSVIILLLTVSTQVGHMTGLTTYHPLLPVCQCWV